MLAMRPRLPGALGLRSLAVAPGDRLRAREELRRRRGAHSALRTPRPAIVGSLSAAITPRAPANWCEALRSEPMMAELCPPFGKIAQWQE
ncbi:hypothetical protein P7K49_012785 [Saguinus oedipus]|uniref:Uncharacterized protein n=1 Tax=Saguinus oedipus TaxID=9490 RepID=A0ABQ9VEN4_SAGOE|nr:hypothetical protein P7K49_012785 [Saguinus oedipus]